VGAVRRLTVRTVAAVLAVVGTTVGAPDTTYRHAPAVVSSSDLASSPDLAVVRTGDPVQGSSVTSVTSDSWDRRGSRQGSGRAASRAPAWEWPLPGPQVVARRFDPPAQRWLPGHRGVDLAGFTGSPVRAVADGVVSYSGVVAGTGVLSIRHGDGVLSTYQPVEDRAATGSPVRAGETVGALAPGGHCLLRSCLHLGARRGELYLDPLLLLRVWTVSLLPQTPRGPQARG
jgi:murein DD-endopeptidase MepM/ murein hydrolase activator NlpD